MWPHATRIRAAGVECFQSYFESKLSTFCVLQKEYALFVKSILLHRSYF